MVRYTKQKPYVYPPYNQRPTTGQALKYIAQDVMDKARSVLPSEEQILARGPSKTALIDVPYLVSKFRKYARERPVKGLEAEVAKLRLQKAQREHLAELERKRQKLLAELEELKGR